MGHPVVSLGENSNYDYNDHSDYLGREETMGKAVWTVAQAKAKFSEVIERAAKQGPQTITRNGRKAAVVVSEEEWQRKTKRKGSLAEFFAASPLRNSGLKIVRRKDRRRDIEL
jgi:prevent-host-death family protein